jgi:hypothetical protein
MFLLVPSRYEEAILSIQSRRKRLPKVQTLVLFTNDLSYIEKSLTMITSSREDQHLPNDTSTSTVTYLLWKPQMNGVGLSFSSRLSALENIRGRLSVSNAIASTLGGGAFMCRHIGLAVQAATSQILIAKQLGNKRLFSRAKLHLAYISIATGEWLVAKKILFDLFILSKELSDFELQNMLIAAVLHYQSTLSLASRHLLDKPSTDFLSSVTLPAVETISTQGQSVFSLLKLYTNDKNFDELSRIRLTSISSTERMLLRSSSSLLQPFLM